MTKAVLQQIYRKLNEIDAKVSALLVKEEKPTREELRAIKRGEREFAEGKFKFWEEIKTKHK